MKHTPKPGAYRELFKSGLIALLKTGELSEQQRKDAVHYLLLLKCLTQKLAVGLPARSMVLMGVFRTSQQMMSKPSANEFGHEFDTDDEGEASEVV